MFQGTLENGYQLLEIKLAYSFKRGANTFLQLITQLNSMKIEAQLNKQPTIRNLAKLLMNSMYGRFGMHPTLSKHSIYTSEQINKITPAWKISNEIQFGELSLLTLILQKEWILENQGIEGLIKHLTNLGNNTNVAIAAAVTAHSRILINTYKLLALKLGLEIYYSDTDSLVLNGPLPEDMIDSAKLGKLKLEHTFKEGIFVMPKVYYLEEEDGTTISKCKGYSGKLTKAQYLELLSGQTLDLKITKWSKSLRDSYVWIQNNTPYNLSYTFKGTVWNPSTQPLPPTTGYYGIPMNSIYSSDFLDSLFSHIDVILKSSNHPSPFFNLIIEVLLETGQVRTVGSGFIVESSTDLVQLKTMLEGFIENFETQSGTPEERQQEAVISSLIKVMDRSNAPNVNWNDPLSLPQGLKAPQSSAKPSRKSSSAMVIIK